MAAIKAMYMLSWRNFTPCKRLVNGGKRCATLTLVWEGEHGELMKQIFYPCKRLVKWRQLKFNVSKYPPWPTARSARSPREWSWRGEHGELMKQIFSPCNQAPSKMTTIKCQCKQVSSMTDCSLRSLSTRVVLEGGAWPITRRRPLARPLWNGLILTTPYIPIHLFPDLSTLDIDSDDHLHSQFRIFNFLPNAMSNYVRVKFPSPNN